MTLTKEAIKTLLSKRFENHKYNSLSTLPLPSTLKDIKKATSRVIKAIKNQEKITIIGDYDVDGVVSTTLMLDFFEFIGFEVNYIIPNRFSDGYGLNINLLKKIDTCNLIITVDNGISAIEAANRCKELGIDLIITDHHTPLDTLPNAYAIINPKQNDCHFVQSNICGAQVAWYFIASLKNALNIDYDLKKILDIVSIAIIADVMPLIDINRVMVKEGLKQLNSSTRASMKIIQKSYATSIDSQTVAFFISPKLNAAGRLYSASSALKFLRAKGEIEALEEWEKLSLINEERKELEKSILSMAIAQVDENDSIIVVSSPDWNEGVIGIVASRLAMKFNKPAIVFSIQDTEAKASGRSVGDVNLFELIKDSSHLLTKFGGHRAAAGLGCKVDKLEEFKNSINLQTKKLDKKLFIKQDTTLGEIKADQIDFELIDIINFYEPFGESNPRVEFRLNKVDIINFKYIGKNREHLKLQLQKDKIIFEAIYFRIESDINKNDKIDVVFQPQINYFNNKSKIQLIIREIYSNYNKY